VPAGTSLALVPLLVPIEAVSYIFRVASLPVRLFANMMAGHTLLKVIVGFSWSMILMGNGMLIANLLAIGILIVLHFLELGVALIQTYIFTILTCIYLKDIYVGH
jgi:ATP synthase subunit 6